MAVPEQIPVVNYVADGVVKKFDVPFEYDQQSDLHIYVDGAEPTIDKYFFADNSFNFYIAPTSGQDVKIKRITPKERDTDYNLHTNTVRPNALNSDFDRLWYVLQEVFSDTGGLSQQLQDEIIARIQGDDAVTEDLKNYIDNMIALITGDPSFNGINADKVNDASGETQQQVNYNGGSKWHSRIDGYKQNERVVLTNGDIAKSIIDENPNDPNVNMVGWVKDNSVSQIFDASGLSQREINDLKADKTYVDSQDSALQSQIDQKAETVYVNAAIGAINTDASKQYATLALANADIANIALNKNIFVSEAVNGGYWYKATAEATTLTKSAYDPLTQAKADATTKANAAEANAKAYTDTTTSLIFQSKLKNGDFANGTTNWSSSNATLAVESGNLVATGTGASAQVAANQSATATVGNKYLVKARFKVDSSESLRVDIGSATALGSGFIQTLTPSADTWFEVHTIRTAVSATFGFTITQVFSSAALATGKKLTVDYVSLVDLTAIFPDDLPSDDVLSEIFSNKAAPYSVDVNDLLQDKLYKDYVKSADAVLLTEDNNTAIGTVELFKADGIAIGSVNSPDGDITPPNNSYKISGFLDVAAFSKLKLSGFVHTNLAYAFYDENYVPITDSYKTGTSQGFVLNGIIDVPANAKYFCKAVKTINIFEEDYATISIKGVLAKNKFDAFALQETTLKLADEDSTEVVRVDLMTDLTKQQGEFTESGVINGDNVSYGFSGYLDVTDFDGVFLFGFTYYQLNRFWLDENQAVIQKFDGNASLAGYIISGFYKKPKGAKYFVANIKNPSYTEANTVKIYGERKLNTSDFQRKGSSGDATQGWETTTDALKTQKDVEVYSDLYPDVKPVKIINYGKQIGYDYGNNINFDTEIYRLGWGLQIAMNLTKPNAPDSIYSVKNVKGANGLLAEWGVEGFSWHVCPPGMDWGQRAWMMMKVGGGNVRSNTLLPIKNASMIQTFAPVWTERRDRAVLGSGFNGGWTELTSSGAIDDQIPTRVMLRSSANFASPEYYRGAYGNSQSAAYDQFFRCRGGYGAAQAAQHGDSIHKQVYSVATGADAQGNPVLRDVAQIEFLYNDDASPESAKIVFKVWNKVTESWEIKLTL